MVSEIDSADLQARLAAGEDLVLLDIRTDAEVAQGKLPGSEHLPMHLIPLRMNELPRNKDVVLYCRSGARSYHACAYLMQQGISNVANLSGGIIGWVRGGHEITHRMAG